MQTEPINTIPVQQFLNTVKSADSSNAKEIKMPLAQAKQLAYCLGIVMARLQGDTEKFVAEYSKKTEEVVTVNMDGGSNWK